MTFFARRGIRYRADGAPDSPVFEPANAAGATACTVTEIPAAFALVSERSSTRHHRTPVPLQRWHFTTLSPFLSKPLPSQFLHFCFFLMFGPFSLVMRF